MLDFFFTFDHLLSVDNFSAYSAAFIQSALKLSTKMEKKQKIKMNEAKVKQKVYWLTAVYLVGKWDFQRIEN